MQCDCERGGEIIFGRGTVNPDIILVGEMVNREDLIFSKPFAGREGDLLKKILLDAGIDLSKVYASKFINCYIDDSGLINKKIKEFHYIDLQNQIYKRKPKIIICFGPIVLRQLLNVSKPISIKAMLGIEHPYKINDLNCRVYGWYSPTYILNCGYKINKDSVNFFRKVNNVIRTQA